MARLFTKMYLVLIATFILFLVMAGLAGNFLFVSPLNEHRNQLYSGTLSLLKADLMSQDSAKWSHIISERADHFGYPVLIKKLTDFPDKLPQLLAGGDIVTSVIDQAEVVMQRISDSDRVLVVSTEESYSQAMHNISSGTFHLVEKHLSSLPVSYWEKEVEKLSTSFGFPLVLLKDNDLQRFGAEQIKQLERGHSVAINSESEGEFLFKRIGTSHFLLQAGPVPNIAVVGGFVWLLMGLILLFGLSVFLLIRPIWRDLSQLDSVAKAFGEGNFEARTTIPKRSALSTLASTFNGMGDRIQQLIRARKELTDSVSHELRTPIARVRFGAEMLYSAKSKEDKDSYLLGIQNDIEEFDTLIDELLTYARLDREKPKLSIQKFMLGTWFAELEDKFIHIAKGNSLSIALSEATNSLVVCFDSTLLERAITNLISNASRYGGDSIEISVESMIDGWTLNVDDNGPGVEKVARAELFKPFSRLETSRNKATGGYGLGLAIVQRIVQLHGGTVDIKDAKLGGARFQMFFPIKSNQ